MPRKLRYEIDLEGTMPTVMREDVAVRGVSAADLEDLSGLMLDAYVDTMDYEGETLEDARAEVAQFLESEDSMLDHSLVALVDGQMASAVLLSRFEGEPLIAYVMTSRVHKRQGIGLFITRRALEGLTSDGFERVGLFITDGNLPSESLFRSLGAVRSEG